MHKEYQGITDRQHLSNAKRNPIKFLKASGKGFFVEREGYAIALCEELRDVITSPVMAAQMKNVLEYRTMEYYRRRYVGGSDVNIFIGNIVSLLKVGFLI